MLVTIEQRDQAADLLVAMVDELGPVPAHVLLREVRVRNSLTKDVVIEGWTHLLENRTLDWRADDSVVIHEAP